MNWPCFCTIAPPADYASEGQKTNNRYHALKIAQTEQYNADFCGVPPVLLIDDVMGELDEHHRQGFLPLLEKCGSGRGEVFA